MPELKGLEAMTDEELLLEEDRLFLDEETNPFRRNQRFSAGRLLLFTLTVPLFFLALKLMDYARQTWHPWILASGNPLTILVYVGCLGAGGLGAYLIWGLLGPRGRGWARVLLHYWPVTLYAIIVIGAHLNR